jgi:hypothetical protein
VPLLHATQGETHASIMKKLADAIMASTQTTKEEQGKLSYRLWGLPEKQQQQLQVWYSGEQGFSF